MHKDDFKFDLNLMLIALFVMATGQLIAAMDVVRPVYRQMLNLEPGPPLYSGTVVTSALFSGVLMTFGLLIALGCYLRLHDYHSRTRDLLSARPPKEACEARGSKGD